MKRIIAASIALLMASTSLNAQIVVDGTLDATGYTRVATQTCNTGFGDNQSELNAMYTAFEGSRLFIMLTGNLEGNFNKLEIFFDSVAGGENTLSSTPEYDFPDNDPPAWNSQRLGNILNPGVGPGLTFDSAFIADYHMFVRRGFDPNAAKFDFNVLDLDFIDRLGGTQQLIDGNAKRVAFDFDAQVGSGSVEPGELANNAANGVINSNIDFALNNNNMAGVSGDTNVTVDTAAAEAVMTGIELSIDVSDLGLDAQQAGTIKVMAIVNGSNHDYVSNQILPGLPELSGNLGADNAGTFLGDLPAVDFEVLAGEQFHCIEYAPGGDCAFQPGDVNEDGDVNLLDVDPFVALIASGGFLCQADINGDGNVDLLDVDPFVVLLSGG